MENIIMYQY